MSSRVFAVRSSVGLAVGSVALVAEVPSRIAWILGSLIATSVYLLAASLQLALVTARTPRTNPNS